MKNLKQQNLKKYAKEFSLNMEFQLHNYSRKKMESGSCLLKFQEDLTYALNV